MPMQLVEEEDRVSVVAQMADPDLVPGLGVAPPLVRVVLLALGKPMLMLVVGVRAKVLVPMGPAEKESEGAVVKDLVRVP